jgi:hypothetical protein
MNLSKKISNGIKLVGLLAVTSCSPQQNLENSSNKDSIISPPIARRDTTYISGRVQGERFQTSFANSNRYTLSLLTSDSIKLIYCYGDVHAAEMDALINPGDSVRFRLLPGWNLYRKDMHLCKEDLVEINRRQIKFN